MDEAGYVKDTTIANIATPLLEVVGSVILMITTPSEKSRFVESFKHLKDPNTGETMFNYFDGAMVCERCAKRSRPEHCTHKDHLLPSWKTKQKQKLAELILADNRDTLLRETRYDIYSVHVSPTTYT